MKSSVKILLTALAAFAAGAALVFYFVKAAPNSGGGEGGERLASAPVKLTQNKNGEAVISLDADTQARLGLKTESPAAAQWQPGVKGYGRVLDPAALAAAAADLESARAAAEASGKEMERLKTLADNVSAKTLETASATATRDQLAFDSLFAKFRLDWGKVLAEKTGRNDFIRQLSSGEAALVRVDLPAGETLPSPPAGARVVPQSDQTHPADADYFDTLPGVDRQTQGQAFLFLAKQPLAPNAAVTGWLKTGGAPVDGVVVLPDAVLRYEGKGWVYVQTGANDFTRSEIPLDRPLNGGWFDAEGISATNRIVTSGAQSVLSAELSGGSFNTGLRD